MKESYDTSNETHSSDSESLLLTRQFSQFLDHDEWNSSWGDKRVREGGKGEGGERVS
jgi:hypothetical protein